MKTNYKLAWLRLPCVGVQGHGKTKTTFEGMKDFISIQGPSPDPDGTLYVTVFFWEKVG